MFRGMSVSVLLEAMEGERFRWGGVVAAASGMCRYSASLRAAVTAARTVARLAGPLAEASSRKVTSRTWWCASMDHCSRTRRARSPAVALSAGQAGDGVDGLPGGPAEGGVLPPAVDLDGLAGVREVQAGDVGGLRGAGLGAAVPPLAGEATGRHLRQGRTVSWACSSGWFRSTTAM